MVPYLQNVQRQQQFQDSIQLWDLGLTTVKRNAVPGLMLCAVSIILQRKFITGSNTKISDLTVCEPQIKTSDVSYFYFLANTNRRFVPMVAVVIYNVIISPGLRYHEYCLERCAPDDPHFLKSSEQG